MQKLFKPSVFFQSYDVECTATIFLVQCITMCGVICVFLCLDILVELRLVTDTDRHAAIAYTTLA